MKKPSRTNTELILRGNMVHAILAIAVPVILNSFLQTVYNLTDTYWLGKIGTEPLAAINLVTPVQNIVLRFGLGATVAGSVMISQYVGAGKMTSARRIANQIFTVTMVFSVLCAVSLALLTPAIVTWLGAEGVTWQHSVSYLRIVILDMPFLLMVNIYQAVRQAQGDTARPMLLNLLGISVNMALDPLLMITFDMGASGAALATVLAKAVPAVIAFRLLCNRRETIHLTRSDMRPDIPLMKDVLRIGLPTALGTSMFQLGFLLMYRNVLVYGVDAVAAYGIGNKINSLISLPSISIGSAVSTIVGQNMGANQPQRAHRGFLLSMLMATGLLFTGGMILSRPALSTAIVRIFTTDASVIAMAGDYLRIIAFWCWTNAVHDSIMNLFQGTGHTEVTMTLNITRIWVLRFATLWFFQHVMHMGVESIWYSVVLSNGIAAILLAILYFTGIWKKSRIKVRA